MVKLIHTCTSCPAQWEGQDELGYWYYFRYRWDNLSIVKSNEPANYLNFDTSEEIKSVCGYTGNGYSGSMSEKELQELTADIIDWSGEIDRKGEAPE